MDYIALAAGVVSLLGAIATLVKARSEREKIEATASETITSTALSLIGPLRERLTEIEDDLRRSKARIQELERDLARANRRIAELESENRRYQRENNHYRCLLEEHNIHVDASR